MQTSTENFVFMIQYFSKFEGIYSVLNLSECYDFKAFSDDGNSTSIFDIEILIRIMIKL